MNFIIKSWDNFNNKKKIYNKNWKSINYYNCTFYVEFIEHTIINKETDDNIFYCRCLEYQFNWLPLRTNYKITRNRMNGDNYLQVIIGMFLRDMKIEKSVLPTCSNWA